MSKPQFCRRAPRASRCRRGFTLVEILVVIAIIAILSGILIPAINKALTTAREGAVRTEVEGLDQAIHSYKLKYGDFPPDFMNWAIVARHYRQAFPSLANSELLLLQRACDFDNPPNDADATESIQAHDPTKIDRAEALYWALGGFSSDPQFPFTGPGGPLEYIPPSSPTATSPLLPVNYQLNTARETPLFDFEPNKLTVEIPDATAVLSAANKTTSNDEAGTTSDPFDLFPIYLNSHDGPYVYFDSRTYTDFVPLATSSVLGFNGYGTPDHGLIRPYVSDQPVLKTSTTSYATDSGSTDPLDQAARSLTAWEFINPSTFQIISAGLSGSFGTTALFDINGDSTVGIDEPLYVRYPSGDAIAAHAAGTKPDHLVVPDFKRFVDQASQSLEEPGGIDNIANFSTGKLIDDLKE